MTRPPKFKALDKPAVVDPPSGFLNADARLGGSATPASIAAVLIERSDSCWVIAGSASEIASRLSASEATVMRFLGAAAEDPLGPPEPGVALRLL